MISAAPPRKRVSQACDRCRSRKDKCDGARPICSTCTAGAHSCSYDPSIKKRGLPEGYVRGLEKLWGLTICEAPAVETTMLALLEREGGAEHLSRAWQAGGQECEKPLLDTWRRSRLFRELESILPLLDGADDRSLKRKRRESSDAPATAATLPSNRNRALSSPDSDRPLSIHIAQPRNLPATVELTQLPSNVWEVLDIYFSYTHCWLPIVEKHNLLRTAYLYPADISSPIAGSGDHAVLWAVLAYTECHRTTITQHAAHTPATPPQEGFQTENRLYENARSLIPNEDGVFELGHVQALLLLTLFHMGQNRWRQAWLLIGQAVRIAIDLRLGDEADDGQSRKRHVYLGCFVLDTLVAARLRRMPTLRTQHTMRQGPLKEDGLDEWNPWTDCLGIRRGTSTNNDSGSRGPGAASSTFNRLLRIAAILNSMISDHAPAEQYGKYRELLVRFELGNKRKPGAMPLPQQYHVDLLHAATRALLRVGADEYGCPWDLFVELLSNANRDYGLLAVPPTFDCLVNIFLQQYGSDRALLSEAGLTELAHILPEMAQSWPVFNDSLCELRKLRASGPSARSQSRDASANRRAGRSSGRHQRSHSALEGAHASPSSSSAFTSSGQAILEAAIQFDPSLLAAGSDAQTTSASPWSLPTPNHPTAGQPATPQPNVESNPPHHRPSESHTDDDSLFNELATPETMRWTNNWDQHLHRLSFTDADEAHQDFHTLFREPNPMYPHSSDSSQHLLPHLGSAAATAAVQKPVDGYTNRHVEAGQILQALSVS